MTPVSRGNGEECGCRDTHGEWVGMLLILIWLPPTTELAVTMEGACGGIILTASHNPKQWNALKLLNEDGEFLNAEEGSEVLRIAEAEDFCYAEVDKLGTQTGTSLITKTY